MLQILMHSTSLYNMTWWLNWKLVLMYLCCKSSCIPSVYMIRHASWTESLCCNVSMLVHFSLWAWHRCCSSDISHRILFGTFWLAEAAQVIGRPEPSIYTLSKNNYNHHNCFGLTSVQLANNTKVTSVQRSIHATHPHEFADEHACMYAQKPHKCTHTQAQPSPPPPPPSTYRGDMITPSTP